MLLSLQVSKDTLRPSIAQLVGVLLDCFKDDSWPVRDGEGIRDHQICF